MCVLPPPCGARSAPTPPAPPPPVTPAALETVPLPPAAAAAEQLTGATLPTQPFAAALLQRLPTSFLSQTDASVVNCFTSNGHLSLHVPEVETRVPNNRLAGKLMELLRLQACLERVRGSVRGGLVWCGF